MKAFVAQGEGRGSARAAGHPRGARRRRPQEYREKLMDEVAENSDELMERYLEGEEIDHDEIVTVLKRGVTDGKIFPVTCGVATKNLGTDAAARGAGRGPALAGDARARSRRSARTARRSRSRPTRTASWSPTSSRPLADPYAGRLNLFRVYSGRAARRLAGHQRHPAGQGADRPAPDPARQGARADRRARAPATSAPSRS